MAGNQRGGTNMSGRRWIAVGVMLAVWTVVVLTATGRAQTAAEFAQTAAFAAAQQNEDGGFAAAPGQPSTLGATNTALRVLDYVGGSALDVPGAIRFVRSCKAPGGGFAQTPGGKPDVVTTALGLLAAGELRIADKAMIDDTVAYLGANAKTFEEVRMAIAGLEAVEATSPDFPRWADQIEALRQPDGCFGTGASRAFASGGAGAAFLRMRMPLQRKEAVIAAIKEGQRPDGAWSKDDGPSDLSSSYRVMRALYMLKEKPDVARLVAYIAHCRKPDGSYSSTPDGPGSLGSTYFAAIILHWIRLLDGRPRVLEPAAFTPLFNGESLAGWEGESSLWSARDGMLVGKSPGVNHNEFLATRQSYRDFIVSVRFRLVDGRGNSGVQFRSVRVPGTEMSGYQADIGENYWGCLYDESRRNRVLVQASQEAQKLLRKDGWNHYVIHAKDDRITLYLNGAASAVYQEEVHSIAREGLIAVQIHAGAPMEVQFRDVLIRPLP
jgi:prenyltransferase beta subunit